MHPAAPCAACLRAATGRGAALAGEGVPGDCGAGEGRGRGGGVDRSVQAALGHRAARAFVGTPSDEFRWCGRRGNGWAQRHVSMINGRGRPRGRRLVSRRGAPQQSAHRQMRMFARRAECRKLAGVTDRASGHLASVDLRSGVSPCLVQKPDRAQGSAPRFPDSQIRISSTLRVTWATSISRRMWAWRRVHPAVSAPSARSRWTPTRPLLSSDPC